VYKRSSVAVKPSAEYRNCYSRVHKWHTRRSVPKSGARRFVAFSLHRPLHMKSSSIWKFTKTTSSEWYTHDPFQLAAALAYYTLFSLAPMVIILTGIVGLFFGSTTAETHILGALSGIVGPQSAEAIQEVARNASKQEGGLSATIIGFLLLLLGAGGVVGQLQHSLNSLWGVAARPDLGWWAVIRARFLSYAMLLAIGFLLLVSLIASTVLSALSKYLGTLLPGADFLWHVVDIVVSFGFTVVLFAMIYKVLPDVHIEWRDVWTGAILTALLFTIGKFLIGLYLGQSSIATTYGAAGSLVSVMLWVYYSALVFFFGAQVTKVYATEYGHGVAPTEYAEPKDEETQRAETKERLQAGRRRAKFYSGR
jgi:membrane protein